MNQFSMQAQRAIQLAIEAAKALSHEYVGSEHLLLGLRRENTSLSARILDKNGIQEDRILDLISKFLSSDTNVAVADTEGYTPSAKRIIENSFREASLENSRLVATEHILISILKDSGCVASRIIATLGVNPQEIYQQIKAVTGNEIFSRDSKVSQPKKNSLIDQYSRDLTFLASKGMLDPCIGRDREIQRVIQILSRRTKNNCCLIGEPGVGKTAVAEGIAEKIISGQVPDIMKQKRLLSLDISGMVAGTKYRGEFEERIKRIIHEAEEDPDILIFIDELHTIIGAGGAEGSLDAANILKPALSRGEIQIIGATTLDEYKKHIEKDAALERRFQTVTLNEPAEDETVEILKGLRKRYEEFHGVTIEDEALVSAAYLSERYIRDRYLPDKAIDIIDETCSREKLKVKTDPLVDDIKEKLSKLSEEKEEAIKNDDFKQAKALKRTEERLKNKLSRLLLKEKESSSQIIITEEDVSRTVSEWTGIPLQKLEEKEKDRLRFLEDILHRRVVSQNEAISAVSKAVRRSRLGLRNPKRPAGSFLFLGPTGVGKTELSKALAEAVFGSEDRLIRVDMSEFMEKYSVSRMIGSPPGYVGYEEGGQLSDKVRRNPYSVVLFDEVEKAHPDVLNILLQILDDGFVTDSKGRKVSFRNTIIIMTSNTGAEQIINPKKLGFDTGDINSDRDYEYMKSKVMEELSHTFRPEFLNRIDETIVFRQITKKDMEEILEIMLRDIKNLLADKDIKISLDQKAKSLLIDKGYDPKYGARPLRRILQTEIEDLLSEKFLDGCLSANSRAFISAKDNKIMIRVSKKRKKSDLKPNDLTEDHETDMVKEETEE